MAVDPPCQGPCSKTEAILSVIWIILSSTWASFCYRLVGQNVSCLPGVGVMREGCGVCSRGSTDEECLAYGIKALASCKLQSQGWHASCLVYLCQPHLLAELVQSKLECSEKPFRCCSILQLCAVVFRTVCCWFSPISPPNSSAAEFSFMYRKFSTIWMWEMEDVVYRANGWCRAQVGVQEETLLLLVSSAVGCSRAAYTWVFAVLSDVLLPCQVHTMRQCFAVSLASVWWEELQGGCCSVLSLQKTCGEERSRLKTTQSTAAKPNHYFREENKVSLTSFPVPKA